MRVAIIAETFVADAPFPALTHRFVGAGDTRREAYKQARSLLRMHRKVDRFFAACTSERVKSGVHKGIFDGVPCRTIYSVRPLRG